MIRCTLCGLRLPEADPVCRLHGLAPALLGVDDAPLPSAADDFELAGYHDLQLIGRGGFGVVYRGESDDGRTIAIKVAHAEQVAGAERLMHEADALEKVGPPFAPAIYARGTERGRPYVVMEFVDLPTLARLLVEHAGPMPMPVIRKHAFAILVAVARVHQCGLVHRDLKPENIFIGDGVAKLIDFGLAKSLTAKEPAGATRTAEDAMGTPEYMAPEQCEGRSEPDVRTDIYALGVLLYEMLSGAPPFFGATAEIQESHRSRRPPRLASRVSISSEIDEVVLRCLAKQPDKRFDSIDALEKALANVLRTPVRLGGPESGRIRLRAEHNGGVGERGPAPVAPAAARDKRAVGLVFFETSAGVTSVQQTLTTLGGQLAQATGTKYVAVFGHDVGDNPGRSAMLAAQGLINRKMCERALVDVAQVLVQTRADGTRRFMSPLFTRKDRFARPDHPDGVMMTRAAAEVLPDLPTAPVGDESDLFTFDMKSGSRELTSMWVGTGGLVGRETLLATLCADAIRTISDAKPTVATIEAEAGYGKSHVASVLAQQLEEIAPSMEVIAVAAQESIGGAVNQTLRDMLQRILELPVAAPADGGRALIIARLGDTIGNQMWAAVALVLGWVLPDHPDVRNLAAAPGALRSAAARALGEALRLRARKRPLAIVFDDAHLADTTTLDALEYATLEEGGAPIWVCVLARPSLVRGRPTWGARAARATKYTLGPLGEQSASTLARRLLQPAENVSKQALDRLFERTQGVPRLLVELIRGLKRDGIVRRIERGTSYYLAAEEIDSLPDLPIVQWSASREVEALPARLAAHARLASVLGSKFATVDVERVLVILEREHGYRDTDLDAAVGIQRLIEAGLLIRHRTGQIDFRHALLRDTVYQSVPDALRIVIHRSAYRMYETSGDLPERDRLPRLAFHAAKSGLSSEAAELYLQLAQRSQEAHAYLDAELSYDAALDNLADQSDERVSMAVRGRALMRFRGGRCDDAFKDFGIARERAKKEGKVETEIEILLDQAEITDWLGDYGRSASLVAEARELPGMIEAELVKARLILAIGRVHYRSGQPEKALEAMKEAAAQAEHIGAGGYYTLVVALLLAAPSSVQLGRLEEAEQMLAQVIEVCTQHGDYHHLAAAINNRMFISLARQQTDRMMADLHRVLEISREVGFPQIEMYTRNNLGECYFLQGQFDAALEHTRHAVDICERIGSGISYLGITLTLLARIELYRGNPGEAGALAARVRSAIASARSADANATMTPGDDVLLRMVELSVHAAGDEAWDTLFELSARAQSQPYEVVELLETRARAAVSRGAGDRARTLLTEALELARRSAVSVVGRVERSLAAADQLKRKNLPESQSV